MKRARATASSLRVNRFMVSQVKSNDTRVYINSSPLIGVQSLNWDTPKKTENVREGGEIAIKRSINSHSDDGKISLRGLLAEGAGDLFFDVQNSGLLSHESFVISARDKVGERVASGCYLSSYGLDFQVNALVDISAEYEFDNYSYNTTGNILNSGDTSNRFSVFQPQDITFYGDWAESIGSTGICAQSISVSVSLDRSPVRVLGNQTPRFRNIKLPVLGKCSIEALKRDSTGINLSPQIDSGGTLTVVCEGTGTSRTVTMENARLIGLSESLDINNRASINFEYEFSPTNNVDILV
jgi:hypothetical protein